MACLIGQMMKSDAKWAEMLHVLEAFRTRQGHCSVPTNSREQPALGRWVAAQRYKRSIGSLTQVQGEQLDRLGFVWSLSEQAWEKQLEALADFKQGHGHCNVPTGWPLNRSLAVWLLNQRHKKKIGRLSADRVARLDALGYSWTVYRVVAEEPKVADRKPVPARTEERIEERLYHIDNSSYSYVQYDGKGRLPGELRKHLADHDGEFPCHMPLPVCPTDFFLDYGRRQERKLRWKGKGRLPGEVLEYLAENGVLPPHH
jgi:hypothetical protein